jgi:hypothetical protein
MKIIAALVIGFYVVLAVCIIIRPILRATRKKTAWVTELSSECEAPPWGGTNP